MAISSQGIGSGLDVNSIVTQLVAIEKQPLKTLQTAASKLQSQVSVYGTVKSQISTLQDSAATLAKDSNWSIQTATTSDVTAATVTVDATATSIELSLAITELAKPQSAVAGGLTAGASIGAPLGTGAGKLTIQLGSWGSDGTGSFVASSSSAVMVDVSESDTLATIRDSINAKNAGVKAIVLTSGGIDRLSLQSTTTGSDSGFAVVSDGGFSALDNLAFVPVTASQAIASGSSIGTFGGPRTGVMTIQAGSRAAGGSFVAGAVTPLSISVDESDTFATLRDKINALPGGTIKASVVTSGVTEKLYLQPTSLGASTEFSVSADPDLAQFFTPSFAATQPSGMQSTQVGLNAVVTINGVSLSSPTNTMTNVVPGVTLNLLKKGASSQVSVSQDKVALQKNIQAFADAYSALSKTLGDATKYVPGGVSGPLQGDSTTVGLQRLLRHWAGSINVGPNQGNLATIGLQIQTDGSMKVNTTTLTTAMKDMTGLQTLFTYVADPAKTTYNKSTDGFGVKLREFAKELLNASGGTSSVSTSNGYVTNKAAALQASIERNVEAQDKVNLRAAAVEKRLRAQYSALDAKMASMTSLSSYVTAQLAQWNKSTS